MGRLLRADQQSGGVMDVAPTRGAPGAECGLDASDADPLAAVGRRAAASA